MAPGFLGSHLSDFLLRDGYRVVCIDNLDTGSLENIQHIKNGSEFRFVQHDLTEPLFLDEPVDVVFHLASPASPIDYQRLPLHTLKVGSYGTHHMLGLAKFKRARFLLASTSEVYGDPQVHPQPETYWGHVNAVGPRGVYDEAKRYAEALTMAYHRQQGVDTCIARIFNTYGARMRRHDGRAIPTFVRQAIEGEPLTVFGDGSQTRSFCYVDDLVRGLFLLAQSDEHLPVNLGNPAGDDPARAGRGRHPRDGLRKRDRLRGVADRRSAGAAAGHHAGSPGPGWDPEVELEEGLRRTVGGLGAGHTVSRAPSGCYPMREPISVIGAGWVGLVTAACFADLGHEVTVCDVDAVRIAELEAGRVPIHEPGLGELLVRNRARLRFTTNPAEMFERARLAFVCVGTPPTYSGDADLSAVWKVIDELSAPKNGATLIMKSTVPPGTGVQVRARLDARSLSHIAYVSNPEFLAEGTAIANFMRPDRVVVGSFRSVEGDRVAMLSKELATPIVRTDVTSAEMIKYASNAFLATKISFINEIANVCEEVGADVTVVANGMGLDQRIGPHFLRAGIGYGGSCFPKDVASLKQLAGNSGYHFQLLTSVIEVNELQKRRVVGKLRKHLGSLRGQTVALLGLAFKPDTNDIREASSLVLALRLLAEGAHVKAWDPVAIEDARPLLAGVATLRGPAGGRFRGRRRSHRHRVE